MKKLILAALLAAFALARGQHVSGGYSRIQNSQVANLKSDQYFSRAEEQARKEIESKYHVKAGKLTQVFSQVVAGINYKMVFESDRGDFEVVVFTQPWTETVSVLEVRDIGETL